MLITGISTFNVVMQCGAVAFFPAGDYLKRRQIRILGPRVRDPGLEIPHRALITRENALVELTLEFHANNLSEAVKSQQCGRVAGLSHDSSWSLEFIRDKRPNARGYPGGNHGIRP